MLQLLRRFFGGTVETPPTPVEEKDAYITPELHTEMLAKKAAVSARRKAFRDTLPPNERDKRNQRLQRRIRTNTPMQFRWVEETRGTPVGFTLFVFHITLHDMLEPACDQLLTEEVLLAGLKCNAVSRVRFQRIGELEAFMEVQPRWVEEFSEPE